MLNRNWRPFAPPFLPSIQNLTHSDSALILLTPIPRCPCPCPLASTGIHLCSQTDTDQLGPGPASHGVLKSLLIPLLRRIKHFSAHGAFASPFFCTYSRLIFVAMPSPGFGHPSREMDGTFGEWMNGANIGIEGNVCPSRVRGDSSRDRSTQKLRS